MTSLLSPQGRTARGRTAPGRDTERSADPRHHRPLLTTAVLGGSASAGLPLALAMLAGMVGWFASDSGAHGAPREGLRVGALGWLLGHGSGISVDGVVVTAIPLGLTVLSLLVVWRLARRVGEAISGHGPDADRIADGERDWTVPMAVTGFAVGYLAVLVVTGSLAGTVETAPSVPRAALNGLLLAGGFGGVAIAVGSGRAAMWSQGVPGSVTATLAAAREVLKHWVLLCTVMFGLALLVDLGTAVNVLAQLHTSPLEAVLYLLVAVLLIPNALVLTGSYLVGPGFAVGTGTLVSPGAVSLGTLPLFPLFAALPDNGSPPLWTSALIVLPPLAAATGVASAQRRRPTSRWDLGALRGCAAGLVTAAVFAIVATYAGGAVGPGRMQNVAPFAGDVLLAGLPAFGVGGLLGGLAMTWWQRRTFGRADEES